MFRAKALALLVSPVLLALACGPSDNGNGNPDGGNVDPPDPDPAYFGLAAERCFIYSDSTGLERYSLEIQLDEVTVTGVSTYRMTWRDNGVLFRQDYMEVTADELLLHRRAEQTNTLSSLTRYDPAPAVLATDMKVGSALESSTTARYSAAGSGAQDFQQTFVTSVEELDAVSAEGSVVEALRLLVAIHTDGGDSTSERWWFTPELGLSRLEFGGGVGRLDLARIFDLEEGTFCAPE